jgi:hypothetical protein
MISMLHHRGSVLLMLLIAVAILAILYAMDMRAIFGPALPTQPAGVEQHPWALEELLVPEGNPVPLPKPPKPTLRQTMMLSGQAFRDDQPRGNVTVIVAADGRVQAQWNADYTHRQKQYHLEATAAGNIDIKQTYTDANGKDKSRLFFIAKGPYKLITEDPKTGRSGENGTVWLLGYMSPEGHTQGTLTLSTDQQWSAVYHYIAQRQ